MKLLKLIPAAAIALTAFIPLEGKTQEICVINNGGYVIDGIRVTNDSRGGYYDNAGGSGFPLGQTRCIKLGDVPVNNGQAYQINYFIQGGKCIPGGNTNDACGCLNNGVLVQTRKESDNGKTFTYSAAGTTTIPSCSLR